MHAHTDAREQPEHKTHRLASAASRRAIRLTVAVLVPAAVATLIAMIALWPGKAENVEPWTGAENVAGQVISVNEQPCPPPDETDPHAPPVPRGMEPRCGDASVRLLDGPDAGAEVKTEIPSGQGAPEVKAGDKVVLIYSEAFDNPGVISYSIVGHERGTALWAVILAFILAVVAFGRMRGVRALVGLGITFSILGLFVVPGILDGSPPLLIAIVGASAIMLVVLFLTHGFTIATSMAVMGTLASLTLTGLLAAGSTSMLKLTGIASEEDSFLAMQYDNVNMLGLLLAGIIIGSLGVLDDVAVTQAYTVTELANANPGMGFRRLYQAASRVGRAHITSVINTIVLAYAGASLPVLLLLTGGGAPIFDMLTDEWLTQEIVRSVVGTLGLIAAVPITTALAALAVRNNPTPGPGRHPPRPRRVDPLEQAWGLDTSGPDPRI